MRFRSSYGRLVPIVVWKDGSDPPGWVRAAVARPLRPARVVDDFLAYRSEATYAAYLTSKYVAFLWTHESAETLPDEWTAVAGALRNGVEIAEREGRLVPQLATHLSEVRREEGGILSVPSYPALVAWCLEWLLDHGGVRPTTCASCGYPWLGGRSAFCDRPAPGRRETCRSLRKYETYTSRHATFHRERTKVYGRKRRGTITAEEYGAWLSENGPGHRDVTWVPFDDWKAGERPRSGRARG